MKKGSPFVWVILCCIAGILAFVLWPLTRPGFFLTDDGEWMVIRLSAFYQSLASGQFPVRMLGRLNNSYGYPVANFLYPGFLYAGSALHILGLSFVDSVKAILVGSVLTGTIATYLWLRSKFRIVPAALGTISFICSPYLLFDLYRRGSVGEVLAMATASVALFAMRRGIVWLLYVSFAFLMISHNTLALILGGMLVILMLIDTRRNAMLSAAGFAVGSTAFFWLPALAEKRLVLFDAVRVSDPSQYFIGLADAGLLGVSVVVSIAVLLIVRSIRRYDAVIVASVAIAIVLSLPISASVWDVRGVSSLVQFPYRFLAVSVCAGPWIVALAADRFRGWKLCGIIVLYAIIWIHGIFGILNGITYVLRPSGYYETNEGTTTVANEYMPRWVFDVPPTRAVETLDVLSGDAVLSSRTFADGVISMRIDAREDSTIQINKIYYPGWGITIDNQRAPVSYRNPLGVMQVRVPQGSHTLVAAFRETPFRFAADVVSLLFIVGYFVLMKKIQAMA